jgi:hypothetical protein
MVTAAAPLVGSRDRVTLGSPPASDLSASAVDRNSSTVVGGFAPAAENRSVFT